MHDIVHAVMKVKKTHHGRISLADWLKAIGDGNDVIAAITDPSLCGGFASCLILFIFFFFLNDRAR